MTVIDTSLLVIILYACDLISCFKICTKNISETPPGSTFLSCMEVNVNADIADVCC